MASRAASVPGFLGKVRERTRTLLGDYLVEHGYLTEEALHLALEEQRVTGDVLGRVLVRNGFIPQKLLIEALHATDITKLGEEQTLLTRVPFEVLADTRTMVLAETDDRVYLATMGNEAEVAEQFAPHYPGAQILFGPASPEAIDEYLDRVEQLLKNDGAVLESLTRSALKYGVSDIHIQPRRESYSVFFRHLGVLQHGHEGSMDEYYTLSAQIKDRSRMDLAERRLPQDGAFQVEHNGRMVDMRVATIPETGGEKIVIRLLDPENANPKLAQLGIARLPRWRSGVSRSDGICLICGPTGSGKTTTLNATVREMDRFGKSIYTLEDPVEYRIPYVSQVNVNHVVGLDFARGVKAFMRADPDIVVVGEIRDLETAQNAIKAAETGHLVLGTLHTSSIRGAIGRLTDIGVEMHELRYLLRAVLVQRLMRTYCKVCNGAGCDKCFNSGYGGRTVVSECEYFALPEEATRMIDGQQWWPGMMDDAAEKAASGLSSQAEMERIFGEEGVAAYQRAVTRLASGRLAHG